MTLKPSKGSVVSVCFCFGASLTIRPSPTPTHLSDNHIPILFGLYTSEGHQRRIDYQTLKAEQSDGTFVFRFGDPSEVQQSSEMEVPDEVVTELDSETGEYQSIVKVFNQKLEKQVTIIDTEIQTGRDSSIEVSDLVRDVDEGVLTKDDETDERISADFLDLIDHGVRSNDEVLEDTEDIELSVIEEVPVDLSESVSSESVDIYDVSGISESDGDFVVDMIDYEAPNVEDSQETELPTTEEVPIELCDVSSSESSNVSSEKLTEPHDTELVPDSKRSEITLHSSESSTEKEKQEIFGAVSTSQIDNNVVVPERVLTDENYPLPTTQVADSVFEEAGSLVYEERAKMENSTEVIHVTNDAENQRTETNSVHENDDAIDEGNKIGNIDASHKVKGEPDLDEGASDDALEEFIDTQESENLNEVYEGDPALVSDGEETVIYDQIENFVQTPDIGEVEPEIEDSAEEREEIVATGYFLSSGAALLSHPSKTIPGVAKIKDGCNPATWMLEVSSNAMEAKLGVDFAEIYANSVLYRRNEKLINELSTSAAGSQELFFPSKYSQSFITQCKACFWKQYWSYWRNPQYNGIRFFDTIGIGLLFGIIFWQKGDKLHKEQDLLNLLGAIYAAVFFLGATNTATVQPVVAIERTVFYRERTAGMYSALPYAFAQVAVEAIYVSIQTFLYGFLLYSMIGFPWQFSKFLWFYYYITMCFLYLTLYGMMIVSLTPNIQIASIAMSFFLSFWNLFAGFVLPRMLI